jgi:DNA-binding HxlR family transcriptional regulator
MRTPRYKSYDLGTGCAVEACLEVIGGKWKGVILHHLMTHGVLRFNEIQRLKPDLSPRILTAQLRELEDDGVVLRKVYPVVPPKVEYSLSKAGETLKPLIQAMQDWGDEHLLRINASVKRPKAVTQLETTSDGDSGLETPPSDKRTKAIRHSSSVAESVALF